MITLVLVTEAHKSVSVIQLVEIPSGVEENAVLRRNHAVSKGFCIIEIFPSVIS